MPPCILITRPLITLKNGENPDTWQMTPHETLARFRRLFVFDVGPSWRRSGTKGGNINEDDVGTFSLFGDVRIVLFYVLRGLNGNILLEEESIH